MPTLEPITDKHLWDSFMARVQPSTFIHSWTWGTFEHELGREIIRFGVFDDQKKLRAIALAVKTVARRGTFLLCPHGPIIDLGQGSEQEKEKEFETYIAIVLKELVRLGKEMKCDFVRISTPIIETPERVQAFRKAGFRDAPIHVHSRISSILDVTKPEQELLALMKKNARYGIRKAERDGIVVASSHKPEDLEIFWNIYQETVQNNSFVPYPKSFLDKEFRAFEKEGSARWYFASHNGKVVSAAMIIFTPWSAFYHHGASARISGGITPSELLQWRIIEDAKAHGCKYYNFWGVVPDADEEHPWAGFSRFKKSFGGYAEHYVPAQDHPLTKKYFLTWAIERFRKWKRGV